MAVRPFTLPTAAGWPKIWGPQDERWPISISDPFDMHNTAVLYRDSGTALPKKEGSLKATWEIPKPIGEDMPALGNGALRNAIISIVSKVENAADELKTKFCARYLGCPIGLIQDVLAKTCQLPVVQGDTEGSFILFNKHFHTCWEPFCLNRWKYPHNRRVLCNIKMTNTFTRWLVICCVWTAVSRTTKNWMLAGNTSCHMSSALKPVEFRISCKFAKLAGSISEARAGQLGCCHGPLSFFQWTMMSPSALWRKLWKTSVSVMLKIFHFVLAWRVTSNGRICGKNLSQVNYTLSYVLETTV